MSKWFLITLGIILLASIFAILARVEAKKDRERIEKGELSADDFDLIESN